MGIKITKDKAVIRLVKEAGKVRSVGRGTGRDRGDVDIKDISGGTIETYTDAINFKDRISLEVGKVKTGIRNRMMD